MSDIDSDAQDFLRERKERQRQDEAIKQIKESKAEQLVRANEKATKQLNEQFTELSEMALQFAEHINVDAEPNERFQVEFKQTNGYVKTNLNTCSIEKVFFEGNGKDPGLRLTLPAGRTKVFKPNGDQKTWRAEGAALPGKRDNEHELREILRFMFDICEKPEGERFVH